VLADGSHHWIGANFYLQIERCAGVAKQSCSVRLEEELYLQKAQALKENIDKFFEGAIEVWILDVPTLYALEVRVMRSQCHPQNGAPVFGQDAVVQGAKTLFSKVASKKWPRAADICARLQEFSRIPVAIQLLCNEQPQGVSKDSSLPLEVKGAINSKARARTVDPDSLLPLDHVTFHAIHSTGKEILFSTDADGRSQDVLHPGKFLLRCDQKGNYDRLEPGMIEVPAAFEPLQFTIMAKMKKRCTFQVVDHLNRPYPRFPMRIVPKEGLNEGITLATKATGQAKSRLGVGVHVASYISEEEPSSWPVDVLSQELEVQDIDAHQLFRIIVKRLRFACEFVLRSRFDEPVRRCPFVVRSKLDGSYIASGTTSDAGVANVELPVGTMQFHLAPKHTSAFVATSFEVQVNDNGDFLPLRQEVETKSVNVQLNLITPDGEPAPFCNFQLKARFSQDGSLSTENALSLCSDDGGRVSVALALLEPYIFSVQPTNVGSEYMPQEFSFLTDRQSITVVVARSVLGVIQEENVVFVLDVSGSMQVYLEDVKSAVNLALVQQFHQTQRHFNMVTFTEIQMEFHDDLVPATPRNLEDAMRFCQHTQAGGGSNLAAAVRYAFKFKKAEAILVITDGKTEVSEDLLTQVKVHYLGHPRRPKIHAVGINCVPGRTKERALQSLAHLTQGSFRSVCLEQDTFVPVALGQKVKGIDLFDQQYVTTDEDTITDAVIEDPSEDDRQQNR